jgi:hypothetical protein
MMQQTAAMLVPGANISCLQEDAAAHNASGVLYFDFCTCVAPQHPMYPPVAPYQGSSSMEASTMFSRLKPAV